ncbi:MAG: biotin--[Blautia sp.]|nr:biotin--[acetyl-CoA-carboxylase] ligase [Blautia sp.]
MNTKQRLELLLVGNSGKYISGNEIAKYLGLSRTAIWKNIRQLEDDGYIIEASTRLGYRLSEESDPVCAFPIEQRLGDHSPQISLEVVGDTTSTNNVLKSRAAELPEWHVLVASHQSSGKGRLGRRFYSPKGTGLYMSVLLRPTLPAEQSIRITTAAAVAACLAIEETTDEKPQIKWVNDVFVRGKKTCGILTEASLNIESGGIDWAVMGIGFNVYEPEGGFPEDIASVAGPIAQEKKGWLRSDLAASFIRHFYDICSDPGRAVFSEEYKKRSFIIGKRINVIRGGASKPAKALDIDEECRLIVEYEDGSRETLSSGEVSIRSMQ